MPMMVTQFMCVGAQKCGTTTLHSALARHPAIALPETKETKFFVSAEEYQKGFQSYLDRHFADRNGRNIMGEVDPDCMYSAESAARIHACLPDCRVIAILRNPIERAYSHYNMSRRYGFESLEFEDALEMEATRLMGSDWDRDHYSYKDRGFYFRHLVPFIRLFGTERIKILMTDELSSDFSGTMNSACRFLGAAEMDWGAPIREKLAAAPRFAWLSRLMHKPTPLRRLARRWLGTTGIAASIVRTLRKANEVPLTGAPIETATRLALAREYRDDIDKLSRTFSLDLSHWR